VDFSMFNTKLSKIQRQQRFLNIFDLGFFN
jgi:hypothetical protein